MTDHIRDVQQVRHFLFSNEEMEMFVFTKIHICHFCRFSAGKTFSFLKWRNGNIFLPRYLFVTFIGYVISLTVILFTSTTAVPSLLSCCLFLVVLYWSTFQTGSLSFLLRIATFITRIPHAHSRKRTVLLLCARCYVKKINLFLVTDCSAPTWEDAHEQEFNLFSRQR